MGYAEFLKEKTQLNGHYGFKPVFMPDYLFDFQKYLTDWAINKGRGALFADCGQSPPEIVLEVDHIDPVSRGGGNEINNLITSCFDCNRGKRDIPLDKIPPTLAENLEIIKEKEDQIKEFRKFITQVKRRETRDINKVAKIYSDNFQEWSLTEKFKRRSIAMFLKKLPLHEVMEAMEIAVSTIDDEDGSIRYFCGVCWRKIKGTSQYGGR